LIERLIEQQLTAPCQIREIEDCTRQEVVVDGGCRMIRNTLVGLTLSS